MLKGLVVGQCHDSALACQDENKRELKFESVLILQCTTVHVSSVPFATSLCNWVTLPLNYFILFLYSG